MVENQTQIPDGWKEVELKGILKYEQPYNYSVESTNYNKNGIPVLTAGKSFILGYTNEKKGIYNNLPVIIFDDFTTDSKFVDFPFKVKSSAMKFLKEKDDEEVSLKMIFEIISKLKLHSIGGDHKRRWISDFSKRKVLLPKSLSEQKKIAQVLSTVDTAIEQTEKLIAKYNRIKTGLMQDLLTKGIDENGNIRTEETHEFKDSELGRIPVEWNVKRLNNCIKRSSTITYGIVQTFEHIENGIPVLRTIDLKENGINPINQLLRTKKIISDRYKRTILEANDIVCNVRASVGDFNLVSEKYIGCNTTRGVARICPSAEYNNGFLVWFLKSKTNEHQMDLLIKGTTFIDINIADLRQIYVLIPRRNEQDAIQSKLDKIQLTIDDYNKQLKKNKSIKTALMQDLLSGKKRVTSLLKEETNDT